MLLWNKEINFAEGRVLKGKPMLLNDIKKKIKLPPALQEVEKQLAAGKRVRRPGWPAECWLRLHQPAGQEPLPYLKADGQFKPWSPSLEDLLAEDYEAV